MKKTEEPYKKSMEVFERDLKNSEAHYPEHIAQSIAFKLFFLYLILLNEETTYNHP